MLNSEDNDSKIYVASRELHFIWLKGRRKSETYDAAHTVVSVPGFFSLDAVNPSVPQISFLIFHHTEFKRLKRTALQAQECCSLWDDIY